MVTVNSLEQPLYLEKACIQGGFRHIVSSCVFSSEWIPCIWGTGFGIKESRSVESSHLNVSGSFSLCPVGITGVRNGLNLWAELWTAVSPPFSSPSLLPFSPPPFPSSPSLSPQEPPQLAWRQRSAPPGDLCLLPVALASPLPPVRSDKRRCGKESHLPEDGALWGHLALHSS